MNETPPQMIVGGGPNGAGKTTFVNETTDDLGLLYLGADKIAAEISSISRVAERVRRGGHHVPDSDVQRRFKRTLNNFWSLYRPLADRWSLAYNESQRIDVAEGVGDELIVYDREIFDLFHKLMDKQANDF